MSRTSRSAFTLVELLVVIAIIGILVAMLLPAVQAARESGRRAKCLNNFKQLALATHNFHDQKKWFPYGRKYDIWDTYTWTELILPYIEQPAVHDNYWTLPATGYTTSYPGPNGPIGNDTRLRTARHTPLQAFVCPSDVGLPMPNEINTNEYGFYRGNYRGCSGSGDIYGNATDGTSGPWGIGAFGVVAGQSVDGGGSVRSDNNTLATFTDGTSYTLLFSEGILPQVTGWGGPLGEQVYGNMGGALFSTSITPNSTAADRPIGPCPQDVGDSQYKPPCLSLGNSAWWTPSAAGAYCTARSKHPGGVLVALGDASARYVSTNVDLVVWRSLGTRGKGEAVSVP